jgi:peptide/nickel transport system substrate-binding protein
MAAAEARFVPKRTSWIAPAVAAVPVRPPTLVLEDEPNSLDTIRNTPFGWLLAPLTQGYLFLVDERGALVPDRALRLPSRANGGISPDGRRITYRIRTGRWSDGAPFDARDVGFTIDALRNPRTAVPDTSAVADIAGWSAPRPDTLVVRLRQPSAPFIASFLTLGANDPFAILPRHVAARYASLDQSSLDRNPVGLGPFRLLRWQRGERLSFVRNRYYWRGPAASPRIDVAIVPNAQTRLLLVRSGALDLTEVTGFGVDVARTVPNTVLVSRTTNVVDYVQFNLRSAALRDVRVRRAMAMAIDRAKLASATYRGTLVPTDTLQFDPRYRADKRLPPYDPSAAASVLRGKHLSVDLAIAAGWRNSASVAVQIASQLEAAGVTVHIRSYSEAEFWGPKDRGGILESARYDLALTSWSPALDPDRSYLFGCAATPPGGGNSMFFCDAAYDRDEAAGARTYDPARRAPFYRAAGNRLISEVPVVPLGFERRIYVVARSLVGFKPNPLGRDYWNAWQFARR